MARSIRTVLSPLLIISYICGLRIVEYPVGRTRPWLSYFYILLLWSIYCFLMIDFILFYIPHTWTRYKILILLHILTGFMSLFIRLYYDKKFRDCLRKLAIVDETLKELGTTTDFQKLDTKMARLIAGWFAIVLILNFGDSFWFQNMFSVLKSFYCSSLANFSTHINLLDDMTFAYTLGYIGLKFDQVNEHLRKLADGEFTDRESRIKRMWENNVMHSQRRFPNTPNSEFTMWIVMHLHLELCKISQEMNSIFGILITIKMANYFYSIAENIWGLFYVLFHNFSSNIKWFYIIMLTSWIFVYLYRLLLINYSCEIVSNKANATRDFISKVICSSRNAEIREHIVQLLLQIIRAPLKFCGLGFFQFGYKYLHKYCTNILTIVIIIIQTNRDKYILHKISKYHGK